MRILITAALGLALAACGSDRATQANQSSATGYNDMGMNGAMPMDQNMSGMPPMNGAANGMMDANTQNMMTKDAMTNDRDTNLANGL